MVVILGAGLAGLSAAYHCKDRDVLVAEREPEVGGLCRSIREDGFTFDYTGHLLHLRDPSIKAWAMELLPDGWAHLHRSAWIHSHDVLTPYPFQANTAGLPIDVRIECLMGFVEAMANGARREGSPVPAATALPGAPPFLTASPPVSADEPTFLDWIHATFGAGFAKHFFEPYNGKMWRRDLSEVTGDWVSWSIPRPELADVLRGAITESETVFGYNPDFLYPAAGGIDHLPRAIADGIAPGVVRTGLAVEELEAGKRRVRFSDGSSEEGEHVLASLPLPALAAMTSDLPDDLVAAARALTHVSIRAVNLGVRGDAPHPDAQWIYFPEDEFLHHRVGIPTALTPAMAPAGHHALVAEISYRPDDDPGRDASLERTLDGLHRCGLLANRDAVTHARVVDIPHAYVVFDRARRELLPKLLAWYVERGVIPMGRYGTWDYLAMEDSLVHGRQVAQWLSSEGS
jgi:protoporphyrinogen oxidase